MKEILEYIEKAERFLNTAKTAFSLSDYDSCVSRIYYAMFFIAEAVLLTKNLTPSSHKGVLSLFGENFIKNGVFSREIGKILTEAYDKRIVGDYGIGFIITREEAEDL